MATQRVQPKKKSTSRLEVLGYLAVIVLSGVAIGVKIAQQPPSPIAPGDQFEALQAVVPVGAEQAFVLVLSPSCSYCAASMPSFKRLVDERDARQSSVAVVAAVGQAVALDEERNLLEENEVVVDALVLLETGSLKIQGVPTTLLIDKEGEVLETWVGQITEERLEELMTRL